MRAICSAGMKPEMIVRSAAHKLGYRFRLHRRELPGKPDLVFPRLRKAILVHGCFWHQHTRCVDGRAPKSNRGYWGPKLDRNVARDKENLTDLKTAGWKVLIVWECETDNEQGLTARLSRFLGSRVIL